MDQENFVAILNWPQPTTSTKVRSFHGVVQFYRKFTRNFSGICTPFLDSMNARVKSKFMWNFEEEKYFETLKK